MESVKWPPRNTCLSCSSIISGVSSSMNKTKFSTKVSNQSSKESAHDFKYLIHSKKNFLKYYLEKSNLIFQQYQNNILQKLKFSIQELMSKTLSYIAFNGWCKFSILKSLIDVIPQQKKAFEINSFGTFFDQFETHSEIS